MMKKNKVELTILVVLPMIFLYRMIFLNEVVTTNDEAERYPINEWRDNYLSVNDETPQWFPNLFQVCHLMEVIYIQMETQQNS